MNNFPMSQNNKWSSDYYLNPDDVLQSGYAQVNPLQPIISTGHGSVIDHYLLGEFCNILFYMVLIPGLFLF